MNRGEVQLAITGPSGSGEKHAALHSRVLDSPTTGRITLAGQEPFGLNDAVQAQFPESAGRVHFSGSSSVAAV